MVIDQLNKYSLRDPVERRMRSGEGVGVEINGVRGRGVQFGCPSKCDWIIWIHFSPGTPQTCGIFMLRKRWRLSQKAKTAHIYKLS